MIESWRRTQQHLLHARDMLGTERDLPWFDEWVEHNELGLAFDALVAAGESAAAPPDFWNSVRAAAQEMNLTSDDDVHGKSVRIVAKWAGRDDTSP